MSRGVFIRCGACCVSWLYASCFTYCNNLGQGCALLFSSHLLLGGCLQVDPSSLLGPGLGLLASVPGARLPVLGQVGQVGRPGCNMKNALRPFKPDCNEAVCGFFFLSFQASAEKTTPCRGKVRER